MEGKPNVIILEVCDDKVVSLKEIMENANVLVYISDHLSNMENTIIPALESDNVKELEKVIVMLLYKGDYVNEEDYGYIEKIIGIVHKHNREIYIPNIEFKPY